MATPRPLKLTRESYASAQNPAKLNPIAKILVKVPTSTIGDCWDFLIPEELSTEAVPGQLVLIPFNHRLLEGYILTRSDQSENANLKFITKTISSIPPLTQTQLSLLEGLSERYGCNRSDFLDSMVPPFSKVGEKRQTAKGALLSHSEPVSQSTLRELRIIPQDSTLSTELFAIIARYPRKKIFIFPEISQLETFAALLHERQTHFVTLHSLLSKSERYEAYLEANRDSTNVILGLRSSTLLSAAAEDLLVVIDDVEATHYEMRSPSWNSRDVALLQANQTNILFLCHAPSLELVRLHQLGWLPSSFQRKPERKRIVCETDGAVGTYRSLITESLRVGPVLVIQNAKGFIRSFTCNDCRNIALCDCGGKLTLGDLLAEPICSECASKISHWSCRWCSSAKPRIASRGLDQSAKEFAQYYPQIPIVLSTAEHRVLRVSQANQLVFSTIGCEPLGSYQAIIFLGAEREYSGVEMRSQERSRNHWAKLLTLLQPDGVLYLQMSREHVAVQELLLGNPFLAAEKEMAERDELNLPPNFRLIRISGSEVELRKIVPVLNQLAVQVLGPFAFDANRSRLLIKSSHEAVKPLLAQFAIINRLLQSQGRDLLTLYLDPSELS